MSSSVVVGSIEFPTIHWPETALNSSPSRPHFIKVCKVSKQRRKPASNTEVTIFCKIIS